ncbi:pYEATS domain-containing protein [Flavobacterium sp. UBA7682]|uniref:pYEATS domain-containing protein n=1 Tax=Flavobacterium sp. UBA7682 TaxID=1946560 RepID=UPI0025BE1CC7|nr:pYEATS domain-containing protein [Flavobacterium sp. UBA7682]
MKATRFKINKGFENYNISQSYEYIGDDYWDWAVWIEAKKEDLEKIEFVTYNLHHTFINPVRVIKDRESKFKLETSGWGTFTIYAILTFTNNTIIQLEHELELEYPKKTLKSTKKK